MGRQSEFWLRFRRRTAGVLFPHFCLSCGREGRVICPECHHQLNALKGVFRCPGCGTLSVWGSVCSRVCRARTPLDGLMAAAPYANGALRELLHQYKYSGIFESGGELTGVVGDFAARFRPVLAGSLGAGTVIVPVPLHPWREAWRGFNQAEALAAAVAASTGFPVRKLLRRRFGWRRQTQLDSPASRLQNVESAISVAPRHTIPETALLVDDVFTTGATLSACARALKARGAKRVWGLTLLRG